MGKQKFYFSRDELYRLYYVDRLTLSTIATMKGCCRDVIHSNLIKYDIPRRTSWEHMIGHVHSKETKDKISRSHIGKKMSMPPWNKGLTKETSKKLRDIGNNISLTTRKIQISKEDLIQLYWTEQKSPREISQILSCCHAYIYKLLDGYGIPRRDPNQIKALANKRMKQLWNNPEYRTKSLTKIFDGLKKRPTTLEDEFMRFIETYDLPLLYCGDGSFWIGNPSKNPDFRSNNGLKLCVEVANHYHHPNPWAEKRIKHFAKYGWNCLVFFGDNKNKLEESEMTILKKIKKFI